ncbi:hypothetical protein [Natronococcus occultus]|uniref:Uncharacterized protein n=1 Tax=Natronococcus occultus SP4 TaxID=694430 RepID=L0K0J5_9EURY|nr:hypothetical protein [Natronococcus occultus]AGB38797.1 hypothetical protein Natoc_3053 [Natronococcus occultus SP4]
MTTDATARRHRLTPPVDLRAALGSLGIEHLVVNRTRLFVIFGTAVLDCRVRQGDLASASEVALAVLDGPSRSTETGAALRDRLLAQLAPTGGSDQGGDAGH